jgi:hypothetical protein
MASRVDMLIKNRMLLAALSARAQMSVVRLTWDRRAQETLEFYYRIRQSVGNRKGKMVDPRTENVKSRRIKNIHGNLRLV